MACSRRNPMATANRKEAGGTKRLKPGYKKGGKTKKPQTGPRAAMKTKEEYLRDLKKKMGGQYTDKEAHEMYKKYSKKYAEGGLAQSREGMPKNVKKYGGKMRKGGYNSKPMVGK